MDWKEFAKMRAEDEGRLRLVQAARATSSALTARQQKWAKDAFRLKELIGDLCPGAADGHDIKCGIVWTGEYLIALSPSFADIRFGKPCGAIVRKVTGRKIEWSNYVNKSYKVWEALQEVDSRAAAVGINTWYNTGVNAATLDEDADEFLLKLAQDGKKPTDTHQLAAYRLGYADARADGAGWEAHIAKQEAATNAMLDDMEDLRAATNPDTGHLYDENQSPYSDTMIPFDAQPKVDIFPRPNTWVTDIAILYKQFPNADDIRWESDRVYTFSDEYTISKNYAAPIDPSKEWCRRFDAVTGKSAEITRLADFAQWKAAKWPQLQTPNK